MNRWLISQPRRSGKSALIRGVEEQIRRALDAGLDQAAIQKCIVLAWWFDDDSDVIDVLAQLIDEKIAAKRENP